MTGLATIFSVASALLATAQEPNQFVLATTLEIQTGIANIGGVAELPNGTFFVSDPSGGRLFVSTDGLSLNSIPDLPSGFVPGGIYQGLADTLFVFDRAGRSVHLLASGSVASSRGAPAALGLRISTTADPLSLDQMGNAYWTTRLARGNRDVVILKAPLGDSGPGVEIASFTPADLIALPGGIRIRKPFAMEDGWAVASSGAVVLVHSEPFQVEWIRNSESILGPIVPVAQVVPVTTADRDSVMAGIRRSLAAANFGGTENIRIPEDAWPDVKPPFVARQIHVDLEDRVWVTRTAPAGSGVVWFDVFTIGKPVVRYEHDAGSRIVGFGIDAVFMALPSEDGERLLRFAI